MYLRLKAWHGSHVYYIEIREWLKNTFSLKRTYAEPDTIKTIFYIRIGYAYKD